MHRNQKLPAIAMIPNTPTPSIPYSLVHATQTMPRTSYHSHRFHQENTQQTSPPMTLADDQEVFLQQLKSDYRQILINYFKEDKKLKQNIDQFINTVFCANIPVPLLIQIHMELIDEFAKRLKLEGRSDEVLLDYRLTLIDILAHLCEVYRSAAPR